MANLTKNIFCANCQEITPHKGEIDGNGEFVFTCLTPDCGRSLKFSADTDIAKFNELLVKHEEHNSGQVKMADQEKKLAALIGEDSTPVTE